MLETMGYAFVVLIRSGVDLAAVDALLFLRGLLSPAAHTAWTGLAAVALWRAADRGWTLRAVLGLLGSFLLVVVLHTTWDVLDSTSPPGCSRS